MPEKYGGGKVTTYEQQGRAVKAGKWADVLRRFGFTSGEVQRDFTPEIWEQLAKVHGINKPNTKTTVDAIVGLLEALERGDQG